MSYDNLKSNAPDSGTVEDCDDLDPDVDMFCLRHGKPLLEGMFGNKASNCEDCEPPEPDGERFRGGEAAAFERDRMAHIQRTLK